MSAIRLADPESGHNSDIHAYEIGLLSLTRSGLYRKSTLFAEAWDPRTSDPWKTAVSLAPPANRPGKELLETPEKFLQVLKSFSEALVEREMKFYQMASPRELAPIWNGFVRRAENKVLLPLGFGTGWLARTLGLIFQKDDFIKRLKPLISPQRQYMERGGAIIFPKTRRWILSAGRPEAPLGWSIWQIV
jgi:hypothetical protein